MHYCDCHEYAKCLLGGSIGVVGLAPDPCEFESLHDLSKEDLGAVGSIVSIKGWRVVKVVNSHRIRRQTYIEVQNSLNGQKYAFQMTGWTMPNRKQSHRPSCFLGWNYSFAVGMEKQNG